MGEIPWKSTKYALNAQEKLIFKLGEMVIFSGVARSVGKEL